jgi:hypothetical protein
MKAKAIKGLCLITLAGFLAGAAGCGGRSAGGEAAALPPPAGARSALKFSPVTLRTVVVVDGQAAPAASGTLTFDVAAGVHSVAITRAGYILNNAADLQQMPAAVGETVEKMLDFTRESVPLPSGWQAAARPVLAKEGETAAEQIP